MKWTVPAKTFLLGEYLALLDAPALLLTTKPCFELNATEGHGSPFHPDSPAGQLYLSSPELQAYQFDWYCPYQNKGGLGGSSAEYVALYKAKCELNQTEFTLSNLLETYRNFHRGSVRPSGYDVLAQSQSGIVFIQSPEDLHISANLLWGFENYGFAIAHTGMKLATHEHLKIVEEKLLELPKYKQEMTDIVIDARNAIDSLQIETLVHCINQYYAYLKKLNLVARHTQAHVTEIRRWEGVLAAKGCGAMGADVILFVYEKYMKKNILEKLSLLDLNLLATEQDMFIC